MYAHLMMSSSYDVVPHAWYSVSSGLLVSDDLLDLADTIVVTGDDSSAVHSSFRAQG